MPAGIGTGRVDSRGTGWEREHETLGERSSWLEAGRDAGCSYDVRRGQVRPAGWREGKKGGCGP